MKNQESKNSKEKIVIPGEVLGVIEEFSPGKNCFEYDGQVISESLGVLQKESEHQVRVKPLRRIYVPRRGTIALGVVVELRKQIANVTLTHYKFGREKVFQSLNYSVNAVLHISNVSDRYVRAIYDGVRPGDHILCKLITTKPEFRVSLFGSKDLGVLSAVCYTCGYEITHLVKRNLIRCNNCGATQNRVLSSYFNKLDKLVIGT